MAWNGVLIKLSLRTNQIVQEFLVETKLTDKLHFSSYCFALFTLSRLNKSTYRLLRDLLPLFSRRLRIDPGTFVLLHDPDSPVRNH